MATSFWSTTGLGLLSLALRISRWIPRSASSGSMSESRRTSRMLHRDITTEEFVVSLFAGGACIEAEDGVGIPEDILNDTRFERAMGFYFVYLRFDWVWSLNLFALILLNFLEKPLWCRKKAAHACDQRDLYFLGQLPYFSKIESLIYEILLLFILACDILVFAFSAQPFRVAPYIRVAFLIMTIRELRMCAITLYGLIGTYLNVLALSLLFLLFASWLAYVTFEDTLQGKTIFSSYGETLYQMFVLFTTSNNPDVWVPAYKISRWYSLFFIVYVLLGVYFLTNLILAVIYDSFKGQGQGYLDREQCISLLNELNKYR
ncbi:hypothetical protein ACQ4PT_049531 [Festuca glaucescens]